MQRRQSVYAITVLNHDYLSALYLIVNHVMILFLQVGDVLVGIPDGMRIKWIEIWIDIEAGR